MCIAVKLCLEHQHKEWRRGCSSKLWLWHIQFVGLETTECKGALQPFSRAGPRPGGLVALEIRISPAQRRTCFLKPATTAWLCQTTCIEWGADPSHACLHGSLSSVPDELGWVQSPNTQVPFLLWLLQSSIFTSRPLSHILLKMLNTRPFLFNPLLQPGVGRQI